MSQIDELGLSLLSRQDERREENIKRERKIRKRARRDQIIGLFGGVAIDIGDKVLANKTNDFLNSEQVYNQRIKYRTAVNYAEHVKHQEKLIKGSGLSTQHYYAEIYRPLILARANEEYPEEELDQDAYNKYIREQAEHYGGEMALQHNEALKRADRVLTSDSYDNIIKMANKRPKDVGDYIAGLFTGRSKQNIDDKAFEAIKNHAATQNADEFIELFEGQYRTTGDLVRSHDFANKVFPGVAAKTFSMSVFSTTVVNDQLIIVKTQNDYDTTSHQWTQMGEKPYNTAMTKTTHDMRTDGQIQIAANEMVKSFNDNFNYGVRGHSILTSKGFELFRAIVPGHIRLESIKTVEELGIVSDAWAQIVSEEANLNDDGKIEVAKTAFALISSTLPVKIKAFMLKMDDPKREETQAELLKAFVIELARDANMVQEFLGGADFIARAKLGTAGTRVGEEAKFWVEDLNGVEHPFETQAEADAFQVILDGLAAPKET